MSVSPPEAAPTARPAAAAGGPGRFARIQRRWWFRLPAIAALLAGIAVFLIWLLLWRNCTG